MLYWLIFGSLGLLLAVILLRAVLFRPKAQRAPAPSPLSGDPESWVTSLAEMVRIPTVSRQDPALEDEAAFTEFCEALPRLFPQVHQTCTLTRFPGRGLLYHWKGSEPGPATVLMAHYDVVPADGEGWTHPPFSAHITDGFLWGRGTLDTKVTVNGILCAAEALMAQGFVPRQDVYFAFSGGEEINGPGAKNIAEFFRSRGIALSLVLDEGGAVVENVFPGVKTPCAMVGIGEKGMLNVRYTARSQGGHASAPTPGTPVSRLARACRRVEGKPFPMRMTAPARKMFDTLGRHSGFGLKILFANLWLFGPLLDRICRKTGGELNALLRTTTAFTMLSGSNAVNVIPTEATMVSNMRLNPDDTVAGAMERLKRTVNDPQVELTALGGFEPSSVSRTDGSGWERVQTAILQTWDCIVSPYLMVQCADARHFSAISDRVYRFSAMALTAQERKLIHGIDERIPLETIQKTVEFYQNLVKQL
ncbi:MAG: M20/M25/M40 family metallo-hydrolase [Ruminococcaceae bacterium]|nr:M20/M25/M40 family metallo-hydrolase [Oscillospiraceae bacterium]